MQNRKREEGFTLVELMVVIVLIGLLAGVVGTQVIPLLFKGKKTTAQTQIKVFEDALKLYYIEKSRYPETLDELTQELPGFPTGILDGGEIPLDPWNEEYIYDPVGGTNKKYLILCKGDDLLEGTDDDITSEPQRAQEGG
ncbi:MAG: type II secretion system protein GspG [Planctomycetota bacterium]|nr:type II secretion system protein GspG [Planctomycetota bacterium]